MIVAWSAVTPTLRSQLKLRVLALPFISNSKPNQTMDRNILSLIGVVESLKHVIDHAELSKKPKNARATSKRLELIRKELVNASLKHAEIVGAARDSIFEVADQLQAHFATHRGMQWILNDLQSVNVQDVEPPLPPPSSSNGPKSLSPEITQLSEALIQIASSHAAAGTPGDGVNCLVRFPGLKGSPAKSGQASAK